MSYLKQDKLEDLLYIHLLIKKYGFEKCFEEYSDFLEIPNEELHSLRKEYLKVKTDKSKLLLENYIKETINELWED